MATKHWLNRMLNPQSVALVGVSERPGSIGHNMIKFLLERGYSGTVYPINPRYNTMAGLYCYDTLSQLPEIPDLVILGVGGRFIEQAFDEAIQLKVGGMVIFFNNYLEEDRSPPLLERLRYKAQAAQIPVCGGNGMGFYNYDCSLLASFDYPPQRPSGHIVLIAHSGSVMTYTANNDSRFRFNLVVSPGQEICGTAADYADYALEQPSTRVVTLFLETVRDVPRFIAMLQKAQARDIPVIITKVGRTEKSAQFAASHSGALAGNDAAFQAVCHHFGVIRTSTIDEMLVTALLFATGRRPSAGGLAAISDSGGLREQLIDLADELDVPFGHISSDTYQTLRATLEHGLEPDNPLDAMGSFNADLKTVWQTSIQALADDPDTALISIEFEFRDEFCHYPELYEAAHTVLQETDKPVFVTSSSVFNHNRHKAIELSQNGLPVIHGVDLALRAVRHLLWHRDQQSLSVGRIPKLNQSLVTHWQTTFRHKPAIDESFALNLLANFGLPTIAHQIVNHVDEALTAANKLGYPVVLKTAEPHIQHKSDVNGVILGLTSPADVTSAYKDLANRLGTRVLIAPMAPNGLELLFGMVNDPQFGPLVMVGAGGIFVELMADTISSLAPFGIDEARRMLQRLKIYPLLQGLRGQPALDTEAVAKTLSDFSAVAAALHGEIAEIDINPIIVYENGCLILDALIVAK